MKKLIITTIVFISIFGLVIFFWVKDKNDEVNKQTLIPRFSTLGLPSGKVGEYYQAELTGLLVGAKAELEIIGLQIPVGLNINDCKQEFNLDIIPKPNVFIKCQLSGYPLKSEVFESSFELSAKDFTNRVIGRFGIFISE